MRNIHSSSQSASLLPCVGARSVAAPKEPADRIGDAIRTINQITRSCVLDTALAIGRFALDEFFGGDPDAFRNRGRSDISFRALARHPDLRVSWTYLWYAVAITVQFEYVPEDIAYQLPLSHHKALVRLRDPELISDFAQAAAQESLTRHQLITRVDEIVGSCKKGRGGGSRRTRTRTGNDGLGELARELSSEPNELRLCGQRTLEVVLEHIRGLATELESVTELIHEQVDEDIVEPGPGAE